MLFGGKIIMNTKAIIFCCNWSVYPGLQLSEDITIESDPDYKIIVNMCSGRLQPDLILEALRDSAWGVMIAAYPPEECEHDGNYKTRRRVLLLKKILVQFGIEPQRLKLEWIDKGESVKFKKSIGSFIEDLKELGPIAKLEIN